jgi:hypothetical protein
MIGSIAPVVAVESFTNGFNRSPPHPPNRTNYLQEVLAILPFTQALRQDWFHCLPLDDFYENDKADENNNYDR